MTIDALSDCTGFERDIHNSNKIGARHGVTPGECEQVFFHVPVVVGDDVTHSETENRFSALGQSDSGRLLLLVFTIREDKVRVISARDMSKKERRIFESHEEDTSIPE